MIAGREYPTPLVVGGVAGVLALVAGQRLLGGGAAKAAPPADPAAADATVAGQLGGDLGQVPAAGADSTWDWWDAGGTTGGGSFPPAGGGGGTPSGGGINDPGAPLPPTPVAPPVTPPAVPPHPTPLPPTAPTRPAGTAAKAIFPAGTYRTAVVSGSTFVRYGSSVTTGGFSAWAAKPVRLRHGSGTTTWFRLLSGAYKGRWFYRYDAHIRWQPV